MVRRVAFFDRPLVLANIDFVRNCFVQLDKLCIRKVECRFKMSLIFLVLCFIGVHRSIFHWTFYLISLGVARVHISFDHFCFISLALVAFRTISSD